MKRHLLTLITVYMVTAASLAMLLSFTAFIPRDLIRTNLSESADYLCDSELFGEMWEGFAPSRTDHYADSILLGIAWQYDSSHPFKSVMESSYYHRDDANENVNLQNAVRSALPADQEYMRYWHGSILLVRPLLMIMSVRGIYILSAVILSALFRVLLIILFRSGDRISAVGMILGTVLTFSFFVPFSLEYTWVYLIMLTASVVVCLRCESIRSLSIVLMVCGILTAFMDFLTAETLTLTVPLLLGIRKLSRKGVSERDLMKGAAGTALSWGVGYAGEMCLKWLLASMTLGINAMDYVAANLHERTGGLVLSEDYFSFFGPVRANFKCLAPFCFGTAGMVAGIVLLLGCAYIGYVYRSASARGRVAVIYALIALIPFIRFLVLRNHTVIHYFFTFRALMAMILAVTLIMGELILRRSDSRSRS